MAAWALYTRGEALLTIDPVAAERLLADAYARALELDERYLTGVSLVSLASARSRSGGPRRAGAGFARVLRHWRDRGDWTHQWVTLRNVVELCVRLDQLRPAALLLGGRIEVELLAAEPGLAVALRSGAQLDDAGLVATALAALAAFAEPDGQGRRR